jgi:hypothetical protein
MKTFRRLSGLRVRAYALAPVLVLALAACHKK